ncbi:unnamed protein product [Adineta steineri]|uniref:Hexosyltransferase n=1 Tax=Adineta steineri TaxID=433720 RepID=A0A815J8Y2_9BILA|nr:unnamed protein product [Adineta steineri]CAF1606264.1 unnamed protein product [Adineta steineri]
MPRSLKSSTPRRFSIVFYLKCAVCILIMYYLNLLFGLKYYFWPEKSFDEEYSLNMIRIDATKIEEHPERLLGSPKNLLSNHFLIENEYLCGRSLDPEILLQPHVLILVKSSCEKFQERQAIRLTWGEKQQLGKKSCKLAFVLGENRHNISIENEMTKYGDIIQIDKLDSYYYTSSKMIMMLRWITDYCTSKSERTSYQDLRNYVLFVDDDYYIDIDSLLLYLRRLDEDPDITTYERRTFITGELIEGSRPRRFLNDRYYVSLIDYPYDMYPAYISTGCFLMTRYNARLFYIASKYIRLFHFDHIYMGILAYSMSIKLIENNELFSTSLSSTMYFHNQTKFLSRWKNIFNNRIDFHVDKKPICIRGYHAQKLIQIWNDIHQTNLTF